MKAGALTALLQEVAATPEKREEEPHSLPPGTVVGRFEIIRELGRGGFGVVYEARDRDLGRQVAVKVVRPGRITEEEGKVSREAEAIARLAHPNLITLHEVGRSEHGPFLVFELLRGKTLDLRMEDGPLPVQEAVHVATEIARGLAHAHAEGVIHRDLKPANVFVTNKGQVKILDFGMAHAFGRRRLSGGTPAYMAPEQWEDAPEDERTDVFALGVMLYRMLTGEYPFPEGKGKWAAEPGAPRKLDVPGAPELAELVEKMLDPVPTRRPRDGAAVLAALTPIEDRLRAKPADGKPPEHAKRRKTTLGDLLAELKRRHVFRVMVGYGIFSFAVLQITEPIMHGAHLPEWVLSVVLILLALGFPVAVILAWVFDLTAQGVKRTPSASGAPGSGRSRLLLPLAASAAALAIVAAGAFAWHVGRREVTPSPSATPSIAVLPFKDLSPNHDQEYFSEGVAEEILSALSKLPGLKVPGTASSFYFKGRNTRLEEIGRELKVEHVLEGSVRVSGRKLRISAEVVRARDGERVWSQTFDRELTDVFAVQEEIARAVVQALRVKLLPAQAALLAEKRPTNPETHRLYLLGKQLILKETPEGVEEGLRALDEAIRLDPGYVPARAWHAYARWLAADVVTPGGRSRPAADYVATNQAALLEAEEVVATAPDDAAAHWVRGFLRSTVSLDQAGAIEDYRRALALEPGDVRSKVDLARALASTGRLSEAGALAQQAAEADPLSADVYRWLGAFQTASGSPDQAVVTLRHGLEVAPGHPRLFRELGTAYLLSGKASESLQAFDASTGWVRNLGQAVAYHQLGRDADSRAGLGRLVAEDESGGGLAYQIAQAHAWRGELDEAFRWLEKALADHDAGMTHLRYDPLLRNLRPDPRYTALLRRMNLPVDGEPVPARAAQAAPAAPSIAVLPFADMSPKHDQEYFADGVAEEIRNALSRIEGLKVIGRTSSFSFKGKSDDLKAIGQKLGVANVLEGSLRKDGSGIRITAQLIRVADGTHLWSQSYDRKLSGIFKIQDEIARSVVGALKVKLLSGTPPVVLPVDSTNPEAYRLYLLGRQFQASGTPDGIEKSVRTLEQVVRLDPNYIPARVWLAVARFDRTNIGPADPARQSEPEFDYRRVGAEGLREAEKVVSLAPSAADGYWLRGLFRNAISFEWAGSIDDYRRALSIAPGDAKILLNYARALMTLGRLPEALALARDAVAIDPLSVDAARALGVVQAASGRAGEAAATFRRGLQLAPENAYLLREFGFACVLDGKGEEALQAAERNPSDWMRSMVQSLAYHQLGREKESRAGLDQLKAFERGGWIKPTYQIAQVHAWRGERELAFQWLDKALADHDGGITYIKFDPLIASLRSDPRYPALLKKLNLPVD